MRRLVLFDIDGTLLTTDGAAKRAFHRALLGVYGTAGPIEKHVFHGKTDPQIARELLRSTGLPDPVIDGRSPELWATYLKELVTELARPEQRTTVYPGVVELLDALAGRADELLVGLLTGNIERGAELKLASAGLGGRFALGAYGSDGEQREALPAIAVARAQALTGRSFRGDEVVIVGDTPRDVTCGSALGVRAIAVATGRHAVEELAAAGAHAVFQDLTETEEVLRSIDADI